jgi:hypothetical protein
VKLEYPSEAKIVQMSGAFFHAVLLDEYGQVYVAGETSDANKLGIDSLRTHSIMKLDTIKEPVSIVHCAVNHSVFVTGKFSTIICVTTLLTIFSVSQKVLICGVMQLSNAPRFNNIPFLTQLSFSPRTEITAVTSAECKLFVHTIDGIYCLPTFNFNISSTQQITWSDRPILVELKPDAFNKSNIGDLRAKASSSHVVFYSVQPNNAQLIRHYLPRLWWIQTKNLLSDIDIVTA